MIKHIVMWDVRGESATERERAALQVKRIFEGMRGRIPGLRHLEVGVDVVAWTMPAMSFSTPNSSPWMR